MAIVVFTFKNCVRGWACGDQNLQIVVIVRVRVLGFGLGLSFLDKLCWRWGCHLLENRVGVEYGGFFRKFMLLLW